MREQAEPPCAGKGEATRSARRTQRREREQMTGTARGKKSGKAAAIEVLRKSGKAMPVKEVVAAALADPQVTGLQGRTPAATLFGRAVHRGEETRRRGRPRRARDDQGASGVQAVYSLGVALAAAVGDWRRADERHCGSLTQSTGTSACQSARARVRSEGVRRSRTRVEASARRCCPPVRVSAPKT